ncbi:uncharacterized protein LOC143812299 [Ranitomeya variabilis]|uniref:uncharacterized protein LOC143812299 n=1 Tax=Ranitomeya variabilis TaxID=490064 RepID=UPI0040566E5B
MGRNYPQASLSEITPPRREACSLRGLLSGRGILSWVRKRHRWNFSKSGFFRPRRTPTRRSRRKGSRTPDDSAITDPLNSRTQPLSNPLCGVGFWYVTAIVTHCTNSKELSFSPNHLGFHGIYMDMTCLQHLLNPRTE